MTSYPRIRVLGFRSFMGSFKATSFLYKYLRMKTKALQLGLLEPSPLFLFYTRDSLPKCDLASSLLQSLYLCGLVTCISRFCPAQVLIGKALWNSAKSRSDPTTFVPKSGRR